MASVLAAKRALTDDAECDGGLREPYMTSLALCDEWIEAHTARWVARSLWCGDQRIGEAVPSVAEPDEWWAHLLHQCEPGAAFGTEAEARAWLEEQARKAGFEVVP
jgi:hypothetical protein